MRYVAEGALLLLLLVTAIGWARQADETARVRRAFRETILVNMTYIAAENKQDREHPCLVRK